ncbi:hypothetical protein [Hymenobacter sedentarius]|nr:hypothetical protein [Hymenobacter sedentarius]
MTKSERRQLNFRNAMLRDLLLFLQQGIITDQTFNTVVNSLEYVVTRKEK